MIIVKMMNYFSYHDTFSIKLFLKYFLELLGVRINAFIEHFRGIEEHMKETYLI